METVRSSPFDWIILGLGGALMVGHLFGLWRRWQGRDVSFVQKLPQYQKALLAITDLLPVLGLAGTVLGLMNTFLAFQSASGGAPDLAQSIRSFAPALSTTLSGLLGIAINIPLNTILWWASRDQTSEEGD